MRQSVDSEDRSIARCGRPRGRDVDGGSARDLRAVTCKVGPARSSPAFCPPPTTLALERGFPGRSFERSQALIGTCINGVVFVLVQVRVAISMSRVNVVSAAESS